VKNKLVMAIVAVFVILGCCVCGGIVVFLANKQQENYAPLAIACDGLPVPGAAAYVRGTPPKMSFFSRGATSTWSYRTMMVPNPQQSEGVSDTALVACAEGATVRHVVENCCYERTVVGVGVPGSEMCFPRVRLGQRVVVHVAASGARLVEREVIGPEPRSCDDWVGRQPQESDFVGTEPESAQYESFFRDPEGAPPQEVLPPPNSVIVPIDAGAVPVK
jgi:hypothetical protein